MAAVIPPALCAQWLPAEDGAKALPNQAVALDVLAINPFAFEGLEAIDMNALMTSGVQRYCDGLALCALEAPVELPSGAIVTRIELDVVDDSAENDVKANFYRCPVGTEGCDDPLAELITTGAPGSTRIGVDLSPAETIDNQLSTYLFEFAPGDDDETRVVGARVFFNAPESRPATDVLAIHPYAHEARTSTGRGSLAADGIQRYCNGASCILTAPVELPSGAVVRRIVLDAVDSNSDDVGLTLARCDVATGACTPLATLATTGTPGGIQIGADLGAPETIDNTTSTYITEVTLGQTNATRLVGVRVEFDAPPSIPRTDRLRVNPFAFEGQSANDIAAIEATEGDRYCSGISCVLIAPVELPSGTQVSRLELSAFDSSGDEVRAVFSRCAVGAASCVDLAEISTVGTPGSDQPGVDLTATEVLNNESFTYQIAVELGGDSNTRLRAVSLVIENAMIFADGFGPGDTSMWSGMVP